MPLFVAVRHCTRSVNDLLHTHAIANSAAPCFLIRKAAPFLDTNLIGMPSMNDLFSILSALVVVYLRLFKIFGSSSNSWDLPHAGQLGRVKKANLLYYTLHVNLLYYILHVKAVVFEVNLCQYFPLVSAAYCISDQTY